VFPLRAGLWLKLNGLGVFRGLILRNIRLWGFAVPVLRMVRGLGVVHVRCIGG